MLTHYSTPLLLNCQSFSELALNLDAIQRYSKIKEETAQLAERFRNYSDVAALNEQMQYNLVDEVQDYVDHHECGIAFLMLVDQLHEFDVAISKEDVKHVRRVADLLEIPYKRWGFVRRLVKS